MRIVAIFLFAGSLFGPASLFGQHVLYNKDADDKGKAAEAAAKKLTSSATTDKELQNLAVLEKAQIDRILSRAAVTMRKDIESFSTWSSVLAMVQTIKDNIDALTLPDPDADNLELQQKELCQQIAHLKESVDRLKTASKPKADSSERLKTQLKPTPPSLNSAINLLGDAKDLEGFAGAPETCSEAPEQDTNKDTTKKDTTKKDTTKKDTTKKDTATKDTAKKDTAKKQTTNKESTTLEKDEEAAKKAEAAAARVEKAVVDGYKEVNALIDTVGKIWSTAHAPGLAPSPGRSALRSAAAVPIHAHSIYPRVRNGTARGRAGSGSSLRRS